jgi:hypothetical protein
MTVTSAPKATRFFNPGITRVLFVATIANATKGSRDPDYLLPTAAELGTAIDLSDDLADLAGWSVTSNFIDTPDFSSSFTPKILGRTTSDDSTLTFYADQGGEDIRTILPREQRGFIVIADGGFGTAGDLADVFPIQVGANTKQRSADNAAATILVSFAITSVPAQDVELPAPAA